MNIMPYTKRFFACVGCNDHEFDVEHIMQATADRSYTWTCPECGAANVVYPRIDGTLEVARDTSQDESYMLAVARIRATTQPTYAVLRVICTPDDDGVESLRFWLEENTCPINPEVVAYVAHGSDDPHGLWQLIGVAPDWRRGDIGHLGDVMEHLEMSAPALAEILKGHES